MKRPYPGMPMQAVYSIIFGRLGLLTIWNAVLTVAVSVALVLVCWQ